MPEPVSFVIPNSCTPAGAPALADAGLRGRAPVGFSALRLFSESAVGLVGGDGRVNQGRRSEKLAIPAGAGRSTPPIDAPGTVSAQTVSGTSTKRMPSGSRPRSLPGRRIRQHRRRTARRRSPTASATTRGRRQIAEERGEKREPGAAQASTSRRYPMPRARGGPTEKAAQRNESRRRPQGPPPGSDPAGIADRFPARGR